MRLIDIHAHVNFNAFKEDSPEVMKRTLDADIGMILVGSQIDTSRRAIEFAERYGKNVYAAVGLHPIHLVDGYWDHKESDESKKSVEGAQKDIVIGFSSRKEIFDYDAYKALALHPKVVTIGEFGLDYFRVEAKTHEELRELQFDAMRQQIRLAREVKKPIMIHCRNAYEDCLQILKEEHADEVGGDIHFFAGDWETAQKFLDFGFHLSFTGVITFTHQYDEVVKNIPLDRIMVETDCPYVAPVPHRGKRNEPLFVEEVAKKVAELKDLPFEKVAEATTRNAIRLFKLV